MQVSGLSRQPVLPWATLGCPHYSSWLARGSSSKAVISLWCEPLHSCHTTSRRHVHGTHSELRLQVKTGSRRGFPIQRELSQMPWRMTPSFCLDELTFVSTSKLFRYGVWKWQRLNSVLCEAIAYLITTFCYVRIRPSLQRVKRDAFTRSFTHRTGMKGQATLADLKLETQSLPLQGS